MDLTSRSLKRKSASANPASSVSDVEEDDNKTEIMLPDLKLLRYSGLDAVFGGNTLNSHGTASSSFENRTPSNEYQFQINPNSKKLLNQMFKKDEDGDTSLHILIAQHNNASVLQFIKLMKQYKASQDYYNIQNNNGETYLHVAAAVDMIDPVLSLLALGSSLLLKDQRGDTPLHVACIENKPRFLIIIIKVASKSVPNDLKTALNMKNCNGKAPLHLAISMKNQQVLAILIEYSLSIDIEESITGKTPLILAVELNDEKSINMLISKGADVNKATFNGWTPLHYASMFGETKNVKNLLNCDANPSTKTQEKETPKDVATNTEIKQLLQSKIRKNQRTSKVK